MSGGERLRRNSSWRGALSPRASLGQTATSPWGDQPALLQIEPSFPTPTLALLPGPPSPGSPMAPCAEGLRGQACPKGLSQLWVTAKTRWGEGSGSSQPWMRPSHFCHPQDMAPGAKASHLGLTRLPQETPELPGNRLESRGLPPPAGLTLGWGLGSRAQHLPHSGTATPCLPRVTRSPFLSWAPPPRGAPGHPRGRGSEGQCQAPRWNCPGPA